MILGLALAATLAALTVTADEEPPDAALLEYLGSFEESDADWLLFDQGADYSTQASEASKEVEAAEHAAAGGDCASSPPEDDERCEPVPQGEAPPELQDEN